jgi:hypothetical protein
MTPKQWCIANRQWRRERNIQHAEFKHRNAASDAERNFWVDVLKLFKF